MASFSTGEMAGRKPLSRGPAELPVVGPSLFEQAQRAAVRASKTMDDLSMAGAPGIRAIDDGGNIWTNARRFRIKDVRPNSRFK